MFPNEAENLPHAGLFPAHNRSMVVALEDYKTGDKRMPMKELIAGLQETLRRNHEKILEAARHDWQRTYGSCDPADACASIRITAAPKRKRRARVVSGLN